MAGFAISTAMMAGCGGNGPQGVEADQKDDENYATSLAKSEDATIESELSQAVDTQSSVRRYSANGETKPYKLASSASFSSRFNRWSGSVAWYRTGSFVYPSIARVSLTRIYEGSEEGDTVYLKGEGRITIRFMERGRKTTKVVDGEVEVWIADRQPDYITGDAYRFQFRPDRRDRDRQFLPRVNGHQGASFTTNGGPIAEKQITFGRGIYFR